MIRYRVVQKDTVAENMANEESQEMLQQLSAAFPDKKYEVEEYQHILPEYKGIGHDPDLH